MGVINLGLLVEKIKRKLEDSGFIKNTDYATASAAGVVKIGDNIDVDDGVISVTFPTVTGGITVDELWTGNVTNEYLDITSALTHPITDYKFLAISQSGGTNVLSGQLLYVPNMSRNTNNSNYMYYGTANCNIRLGEGTVSIQGATQNGLKLLGIK